MSNSFLKRFTNSNFFLLGIFVLIASSLFVMQSISANSTTFSSYYLYLLIFNITLAIVLLIVILNHIYGLIKGVFAKSSGSRLQLRLSGILVFVTLTPLIIFFIFAINMINRGVEDWFDVPVESVFQDSQDLSTAIVNIDYNNKLRQMNQVASFLSANTGSDILASVLERQREQIQATELALFNNEKSLIAAASPRLDVLTSTPSNSIFDYVKTGNPIVNTIQINNKNVIQVLIKLPVSRPIFLYGIFPITEDILKLSERINEASLEYKKMIDLREPLKESLTINLFLGLLLALLGAIVVALRLTERFISPIKELARATAQIGEGNFDVKLEDNQKDELGFLVRAFKIMANKIKTSNAEITASKSLIEERNLYLQDLLANMSSGVLCINTDYELVDYNQSAQDILGIDFSQLQNVSIEKIVNQYTQLEKIVALVHQGTKPKSMQFEIKNENENKPTRVLMCKIKEQYQYGKKVYLIIFDDVTEIIEAQRDSAWSEVAKRMAHEIKNPLTPIQLSAERINRKYAKLLNAEDQMGLNSMTTTINKQVLTIKKMVEDFIQYGKNPKLVEKQVDVNQLLTEVANLYVQGNIEIDFQLNLSRKVLGDENRLRQLFNNLIKNSVEAIENQQKQDENHKGFIQLETFITANRMARVIFRDNGGGIDYDILDKIFVPYVSSKPKGTGLGMSIVKKIIEEHNAKIQIKNIEKPDGAEITIDFPMDKNDAIE